MSDIQQEISTDYDLDYEDETMDGGDLDQELTNLVSMENELSQLCDSAIAVESFGINPTAFVILKTTGLLSGTSLDALAMENFQVQGNEDPETVMALESLVDKIKDKAAAWSAKILTFTKSMVDKVLSSIGSAWTNITETGKNLTSKAWDKTKAAGRVMKAHPYKTVAAGVVAVASIAAIAAFCASRLPGACANESALKSFLLKLKEMVSGVKSPGDEFVVTVKEWNVGKTVSGSPITFIYTEKELIKKVSETSNTLGWTQTSVKAVSGQASQAWTSLRSSLSSLSGKIVTTVKSINDMSGGEAADKLAKNVTAKSGSKLLGWASGETLKKMYMGALWAVVGMLYMLLKDVAYKGFRMVADTFKTLKSNTETAAA